MDSCRAVESEFDKAVKKLSINTVGIEKVISKLTVFRDELKNSEFLVFNTRVNTTYTNMISKCTFCRHR